MRKKEKKKKQQLGVNFKERRGTGVRTELGESLNLTVFPYGQLHIISLSKQSLPFQNIFIL